MKKIITYLLVLISLAANGQIVNKFRDSSWFKSGVRFDSTLVFSKGAGSGKVWTSDATGRGTWQTLTASGVTQSDLDDSISAVRSVRKVDTLYKSADSIIYKINGFRYSIQVDSQATFNLSKNAAGDSIIIHHNGVRYSAKDSVSDVTDLATKTALSDTSLLLRGLIPDISGYATKMALNDSISTLRNVRKSDTSYMGLNGTRDSIVYTNVINGTSHRYSIRDSSITPPTFSLSKNTSRDSIVTIFSGVRSAVKDSFASSTVRKVDSIYRTAGKDSIIFNINNTRYSIKDSTAGVGLGLTNTSGVITSNLSTGVSGGQSVIGGTASGNNLTLSSTTHATKGKLLFGTSAYDEVNNKLGIGTTTPASKLEVRSPSGGVGTGIGLIQAADGFPNTSYIPIDFTVPTTGLIGQFLATASNYYEATVNLAANSVALFNYGNGTSGQLALGAAASSGYITFNAGGYGTSTERMRITSNGNVGIGTTTPNASAILDIESTTKGVSIPTMTATQASAISSPKKSLMLYVTNTNGTFTSAGWWGYNGTIWKLICAE